MHLSLLSLFPIFTINFYIAAAAQRISVLRNCIPQWRLFPLDEKRFLWRTALAAEQRKQDQGPHTCSKNYRDGSELIYWVEVTWSPSVFWAKIIGNWEEGRVGQCMPLVRPRCTQNVWVAASKAEFLLCELRNWRWFWLAIGASNELIIILNHKWMIPLSKHYANPKKQDKDSNWPSPKTQEKRPCKRPPSW